LFVSFSVHNLLHVNTTDEVGCLKIATQECL